MIPRHATLLHRPCCISTSAVAKCSQPSGNCSARKMRVITLFTSDPDPSQEGRGLAVTSPGRCLHIKRREGLIFFSPSLPTLSVFLKFGAKSYSFLSAPASESQSHVKAFQEYHRTRMKRIMFHLEYLDVQHCHGFVFHFHSASNLNICTVGGEL